MNLIILKQQSSKAIVVFILLCFFSSAFYIPPCGTFGANFGLTRFLWFTKAKLVT